MPMLPTFMSLHKHAGWGATTSKHTIHHTYLCGIQNPTLDSVLLKGSGMNFKVIMQSSTLHNIHHLQGGWHSMTILNNNPISAYTSHPTYLSESSNGKCRVLNGANSCSTQQNSHCDSWTFCLCPLFPPSFLSLFLSTGWTRVSTSLVLLASFGVEWQMGSWWVLMSAVWPAAAVN